MVVTSSRGTPFKLRTMAQNHQTYSEESSPVGHLLGLRPQSINGRQVPPLSFGKLHSGPELDPLDPWMAWSYCISGIALRHGTVDAWTRHPPAFLRRHIQALNVHGFQAHHCSSHHGRLGQGTKIIRRGWQGSHPHCNVANITGFVFSGPSVSGWRKGPCCKRCGRYLTNVTYRLGVEHCSRQGGVVSNRLTCSCNAIDVMNISK
mmetsp:Transcript_37223/g.75826  ORF Transcript_37223/g.75826 Transcript_37223/m.75826 type:complete len:205 (-) Transcript_37223:877-1491(-)